MAEPKKGLFQRWFGGEEPKAPETSAPVQVAPEPARPEAIPAADASSAAQAPAAAHQALASPPAAPPPPAPSPPPPSEPAAAAEAPRSWWQRLTGGLARTSNALTDGIAAVFVKRKLDASTLDELEDVLVQADFGLETATRVIDRLAEGRFDKDISDEAVRGILASEVEAALRPVAQPLALAPGAAPHVILVVGVNGTGKTTTIGKLAARLARDGKRVVIAAGDTFRAAAIDQLKIWGERAGAPVIARSPGADAAGLAYDALVEAKESGADVLLIDTAGRLQNRAELMAELEKIVRVLRKLDPATPHSVLLVLDATTGQNAMTQVEIFRKVAGVTGLVMTKLDGTARGGILVAIAARHKLPVHFIGVGEGVDDLAPFDPAEFAQAIAGLGG